MALENKLQQVKTLLS